MDALFAVLVLGGVLVAVWWLARMNEIFRVSIRDGRVLVVGGRVPAQILHGFADVAKRANVKNGTITAVAGQHHARLVISGVDEGTAQRFRNVFGQHPVQKLRGVTVSTPRNLGQWLGIAWLAWMLVGRGRSDG
jgi:hypothetical protein